MTQSQNLLLIVSPDMQKSHALTRGQELARRTGAKLHLCLVEYVPAIAALRHIDESVMRLAIDNHMNIRMQWLNDEVAALVRSGIQATCSALWARHIDEAIIDTVLEKGPDLVIKDVEAAMPVLRTIFTPPDWQLLRLCPVPLMLVNPQASPSPKRIIATVDPMEDGDNPNELNDRILRTSQAIANQCDAELHAVYAYPHPDIPTKPIAGIEPTERTRIQQKARETHLAAFTRLMDRYSVPAECRHFLEGKDIESAISDFADRTDTDLIVLGTVYRSAIDRLMLGSTAERLLYRVDCDVMTLKPKNFPDHLKKAFKVDATLILKYPRDVN